MQCKCEFESEIVISKSKTRDNARVFVFLE